MKVHLKGSTVVVTPDCKINIAATLDCGQCFRWEAMEDGRYRGIAFGKRITLYERDGCLCFENISLDDFNTTFRHYFDLDRDYTQIRTQIAAHPVLTDAVAFAPDIHILNQEPWETLCSFIISQNNNIPRIKGIVDRLCSAFGQPIDGGGFAFPPASVLAPLEAEDLAGLRAGFRARYILDAARRVDSGEINFDAIAAMPLADARASLMRITGVGIKVAECALLFGMGHIDAFPIDVWIQRAMAALLPDGLPPEFLPVAGIVQQYIFHYARSSGRLAFDGPSGGQTACVG